MAALQALRPAASGIVRNPILVVLAALFGVSQLPNLFVQPNQPLLAAGVSLATTGMLLLVLPFFQGGILGMASEAVRGKTSLATLIAEGKANYVSLLLAYLVLLAINLVFAFVVFFGVLVGVVGASASGATLAGDWTLLAVIGIVGGGLVLVYLLLTFAIQFYGHAIVLDDRDLVAGFRRSAGLVRSNLLSVLGYSLILLAGGVVFGAFGAAASLGAGPQQPPESPLADVVAFEPTTGIAVFFAVIYVLATGVFGAFYATYSVAFYESIGGTAESSQR